jgi:DNA-binding MarR family transcriptional regulator
MPGVPRSVDPVLHVMRLIWAVDHELHSLSKRMHAAIGLTIPQRMALLVIGRQPGIPASEIATLLHVHPGTMSGIIRRLEAGKYVERLGDEKDARRMRLSLTARGRQANAQPAGTFEAAVRRTLAATTPAQLASFEDVLTRLAKTLRETVDGQTARGTLRAVARRR